MQTDVRGSRRDAFEKSKTLKLLTVFCALCKKYFVYELEINWENSASLATRTKCNSFYLKTWKFLLSNKKFLFPLIIFRIN